MATNAIQTDRSTQIGIHQARRADTTSAGGGNHRPGVVNPVCRPSGPLGFYFAPATGAFDPGRGCTSPPGLEPIVSIQRPSRFFGAVGLANWANEGSPAMAVRGT
jgi:hypothetical protein